MFSDSTHALSVSCHSPTSSCLCRLCDLVWVWNNAHNTAYVVTENGFHSVSYGNKEHESLWSSELCTELDIWVNNCVKSLLNTRIKGRQRLVWIEKEEKQEEMERLQGDGERQTTKWLKVNWSRPDSVNLWWDCSTVESNRAERIRGRQWDGETGWINPHRACV